MATSTLVINTLDRDRILQWTGNTGTWVKANGAILCPGAFPESCEHDAARTQYAAELAAGHIQVKLVTDLEQISREEADRLLRGGNTNQSKIENTLDIVSIKEQKKDSLTPNRKTSMFAKGGIESHQNEGKDILESGMQTEQEDAKQISVFESAKTHPVTVEVKEIVEKATGTKVFKREESFSVERSVFDKMATTSVDQAITDSTNTGKGRGRPGKKA